jgi:hypothetical protein
MRNFYPRKIKLFYLLGRRLGASRIRSGDAVEDESTNDGWVSNPDIPTKSPAHETDQYIYLKYFSSSLFFLIFAKYLLYTYVPKLSLKLM